MRSAWLVALLAGGATVFAFAPFGLFALAFLGLGVLAWLLADAARARAGFALGFAWGFGAFAAGVSWLYVALERYGGVPAPVAALSKRIKEQFDPAGIFNPGRMAGAF